MRGLVCFTICLCILPAASNAATYLARYKDLSQATVAVQEAGGRVVRHFDPIRVLVAESNAPDFAAELKASRAFRYVVQDRPMQRVPRPLPPRPPRGASIAPIAAASSNPTGTAYLGAQWNLARTKTVDAWQVTQGHPDVKVAVLDSGYCAHHVDTEGKIDVANSASFWDERNTGNNPNYDALPQACKDAVDACPECPDWEDYYGHGTLVASVISTNNVLTAGAAPNITLRVIKINGCLVGDLQAALSATLSGLDHALATKNNILVLSLQAPLDRSVPLERKVWTDLKRYFRFIRDQGVLVVSAAGNYGFVGEASTGIDLDNLGSIRIVPCMLPGVLCVGGTTKSDEHWSGSNYGVRWPKMVAPSGEDPGTPGTPGYDETKGIIGPCPPHLVVGFGVCHNGVCHNDGASCSSDSECGSNGPCDLQACSSDSECGSNGPCDLRDLFRTYDNPCSVDDPSRVVSDRGTSYATPLVAAAAALVDSVAPGGPGAFKPSQIRRRLLKGLDDLGDPGPDKDFSKGRLNTLNALPPHYTPPTAAPMETATPTVTVSPTQTPTDTPVPPTDTPVPPTDTPVPPTDTPTPTVTVPPTPIDNGDGTVSDPATGLMWEKKTDDGGVHDKDNQYKWAGRCSVNTTKRCQPTAAAEALCKAQTPAAYWTAGCEQCAGGDGVCTVATPSLTTVWDWLDGLRTSNFAGHNDWRLPSEDGCNSCYSGQACACSPSELESILLSPFPCATDPCIDPIFGPTKALVGFYWSSSTDAASPDLAWEVYFQNGSTGLAGKDSDLFVRAVR